MSTSHQHATWLRLLPLSGAAYAILQAAGNLTIGDFPDGHTATNDLVSYYASHHDQVELGGNLLGLSTFFLALFGVALALRAGRSRAAALIIGIGAAASVVDEAFSAATYSLLGSISTSSTLDPAALQAWHLTGSEFGLGVGLSVLLVGVFVAALSSEGIPSWLGWTALILGIAQFTPIGFLAYLLSLPWSLAAGFVLAARRPEHSSAADPVPVVQA